MADPRLEPRLERELDRLEAAGQGGRLVQVVIEHARPAVEPTTPEQSYALLAPIMARLTALGARQYSRIPLATAVSASLTASQIRAIAGHPDVRLIHLAEPEIVTT